MANAAILPDTIASSPLQMVVVGQLLPNSNVTKGKYTDASLPVNHPLLSFTVGLAGMVDEARSVAFAGGINDFHGTARSQQPSASALLSLKVEPVQQHKQCMQCTLWIKPSQLCGPHAIG